MNLRSCPGAVSVESNNTVKSGPRQGWGNQVPEWQGEVSFLFPLSLSSAIRKIDSFSGIHPAAVTKIHTHLVPSKPPSASSIMQPTKPSSPACQSEISLHQDWVDRMGGWMEGCKEGWMDGKVGGCMNGWVDGEMDGCVNGGMEWHWNEWADGRPIQEWTDRGMDGDNALMDKWKETQRCR